MPTPVPPPFSKSAPTAAGLCDDLCDAGIFVALAIDATGKESLSFILTDSAAMTVPAAKSMATLARMFSESVVFRDCMIEYLRDCRAVYSMPAKLEQVA